MATGTGKTRTAIGLAYRLLKSHRFRRILLLVDRRALGDQAYEAFAQTRLEGQQSFTDIYDVKRLGDVEPDADTRLHFATIQGVVRRILYSPDDRLAPPPDQYDCIIVDECHHGYNLDRELSEDELSFRNEADYVSKYTRALDHFDAVKVSDRTRSLVKHRRLDEEPNTVLRLSAAWVPAPLVPAADSA